MTQTAPIRSSEPTQLDRGGALGYVNRLARASNTNFYYAFLTMPRARRDAIISVYAFCRSVDDAADEAADTQQAARSLAWWKAELARGFDGNATHPVAIQSAAAAHAFGLPRQLFEDVLRGVEMDLSPRRFATWEDLALYCDLVAGAVGRMCVRIFGRSDEIADRYAAELGNGLQLTNILRDLGPDAGRGRFYLPTEELQRFGLDEHEAVFGTSAKRREYLGFQADRARRLLDHAGDLIVHDPQPYCAAEVMRAIYANLLTRVQRAGFPADRVQRVPRAMKAALAMRVWLRTRWRGKPRR
ncbi:MAG: squalene/phytoene synthase family protein [Acidobacteriota bacterium]